MSPLLKTSFPATALGYPADWDVDALRGQVSDHVARLAGQGDISLSFKRIRFQVEDSPVYRDLMRRWAQMDAAERLAGWRNLLEAIDRIGRDVLPACVRCGECCRKGSPVLHVEDLELLRQGKIPWNVIFTLRRGEPVEAPMENRLLFLPDERIKLREKKGTRECIFFDNAKDRCAVYPDRPLQCRAQSCWDPAPSVELADRPCLRRENIFEGVDLILDLMAEHSRRCSFEKLNDAFTRLQADNGETIQEALELLAYEDHFRHFFGERLNIPEDTLDLVFGRSFAELAPIFGFEVRVEPDGTHRLEPGDP